MVLVIPSMASTDVCVALNCSDLNRNFIGCLGCLTGQRFHFRCDHGKSAPGITSTSSLDGRIKSQQVGLCRYLADQFFDDIADFLRGQRQSLNFRVSIIRLQDGMAGNSAISYDLLGNLTNGGIQFLNRGGDCLGILRCCFCSRRDSRCLLRRFFGGAGHRLGRIA